MRVGITLEELRAGVADLYALAEQAEREPSALTVALRAPVSFEERHTGTALTFMGTIADVRGRLEACRETGVGHVVLDCFYSIPGAVEHGSVDDFLRTLERLATTVGVEL